MHDLSGCKVHDSHAVGAAIGRWQLGLVYARNSGRRSGQGHVKKLPIARQLDAARPFADLDAADDLSRARVDDYDPPARFVADVDERSGRPCLIRWGLLLMGTA